MGELTQAIGKILKRLSYSAFLFGFFVIGFQIGMMYHQHYLETGDTFMEWLDMEKICDTELEYHSIDSFEYTCDERVKDYEKLVKYVRIEVLLVFLVVLFDFIGNPEDHWIKNLLGWIKSIDLK